MADSKEIATPTIYHVMFMDDHISNIAAELARKARTIADLYDIEHKTVPPASEFKEEFQQILERYLK